MALSSDLHKLATRARIVVWISGASSGIGAALAASVPYAGARVIGISRRPPSVGEHVEADVSDPASWPRVAGHFADVVADAEAAVFLHIAGVATPGGSVTPADPDAYTAAVLSSCASGLALGKAFLDACRAAGTPATLVVGSTPAAQLYGASDHGAGDAALQYRAAAVDTEAHSRVLCVLPYGGDTPSVAGKPWAAAGPGEPGTPEANAAQIWSLVLDGLDPTRPRRSARCPQNRAASRDRGYDEPPVPLITQSVRRELTPRGGTLH